MPKILKLRLVANPPVSDNITRFQDNDLKCNESLIILVCKKVINFKAIMQVNENALAVPLFINNGHTR